MDITPWMIYLIGNADSIIGISLFCLGTAFLVAIFSMIGWIVNSDSYEYERIMEEKCQHIAKLAFITMFISAPIAVLTPSTKTAAAMFVIPAIANNENVKKVGSGIYELAVAWMEELKPKSSKQTTTKTTNNKE